LSVFGIAPYECITALGQILVLMILVKVYSGHNRGQAVGFDNTNKGSQIRGEK